MARYRRIDVRMWGDDKFRRLSPQQPSGQACWIYLLIGPETGIIPGLYRAGEATLAEGLGWSLKSFRESFAESFSAGLVKADWKARVVWVPRAIVYNKPQNPNIVKSWQVAWDEIPECDLKAEAYQVLKSAMESFGESFAESFVKACVNHSGNHLANPLVLVLDSISSSPEGVIGETPVSESPQLEVTLPEWVPADAWNDYALMRRRLRKPLTDAAIRLTVRELEKLRNEGADVRAVLEQSTQRGWQGVFPLGGTGDRSNRTANAQTAAVVQRQLAKARAKDEDERIANARVVGKGSS